MTSDSFNRLSLTWEHQPWGGGQMRLAFEVLCSMALTRLHLQIFQGWGTAVFVFQIKVLLCFFFKRQIRVCPLTPPGQTQPETLVFSLLFMMGPVLKEVVQKLWLREQVALKKSLNSQIMEKHVFWIEKCPWFPERGLWAWHSVRGGGLLCVTYKYLYKHIYTYLLISEYYKEYQPDKPLNSTYTICSRPQSKCSDEDDCSAQQKRVSLQGQPQSRHKDL